MNESQQFFPGFHSGNEVTETNSTENKIMNTNDTKRTGDELADVSCVPLNENDGTAGTVPPESEHSGSQSECDLGSKNTASGAVTKEKNGSDGDIYSQLAKIGIGRMDAVESVRLIGGLEIRKPNKDEWVMCHPSLKVSLYIYRPTGGQRTYMVFPEVAEVMGAVCKPVLLTLTVNKKGNYFLWPIAIPLSENSYLAHLSSQEAGEAAAKDWVKVAWEATRYKVYRRPAKLAPPEWTEQITTVDEMLRLACKWGANEVITCPGHPAVKELLGLD